MSNRPTDQIKYNQARRVFKKLLRKRLMVWMPTNQLHDLNVEVTRIYSHNMFEYLAFMRIRPRGFRAPRRVPNNTKIVFHLIMGSAIFRYKDKDNILESGQFISVAPSEYYAVRSHKQGETAIFVMQYVDMSKQRLKGPRSRHLAITQLSHQELEQQREEERMHQQASGCNLEVLVPRNGDHGPDNETGEQNLVPPRRRSARLLAARNRKCG